MRRTIIGALWGMIFYLLGHVVVGLIVGSQAVDGWRPLIALVAATLAAAGSWKGWLPGTQTARDSNKHG
jgi:amino acid transporter